MCKNTQCPKWSPVSTAQCRTCITKRYKSKYPLKYKLQTLKDNAKRRGIFFAISYDEFVTFVNENIDKFDLRGRTKMSFHIDRIDETRGYTIDNIQLITNIDNVKKWLTWVSKNPDGTNNFRYVKRITERCIDHDDVPF